MDAEAHLAGTGAINIYVQFTLNKRTHNLDWPGEWLQRIFLNQAPSAKI